MIHDTVIFQRSFNGFLTSCFEKDERLEDLLNFNRSPDENCASFNHINQGLTSLQGMFELYNYLYDSLQYV